MNLLEAYLDCVNQAKAAYFYHRNMMNHYWPNPYKAVVPKNDSLYRFHRNSCMELGRAFTRNNLSLYPRKGF